MSFPKISLFIMAAGLLTVSCNQKEPAEQVKSNNLPKATTATGTTSASFAIVNIDSLSTGYELCKIRVAELESKQKSYSNQINNKMKAFQAHAAKFQEDYQSGKFTSQQDFEKAQAKLQKEQTEIQKMQERIEGEMAQAMQSYQSTLQDSINNFIKVFNKDGKYKAIFSQSGNNILYADPSVDITQEVIEGLNKRYQKKK